MLRAVTFAPAFTHALHNALRDQALAPWVGDAAYDRALADLYERYPTTVDLLARAVARTRGGE